MEVSKSLMRKTQRGAANLAKLSSAHRRSQVKCQPLQTVAVTLNTVKRVKLFLFAIK